MASPSLVHLILQLLAQSARPLTANEIGYIIWRLNLNLSLRFVRGWGSSFYCGEIQQALRHLREVNLVTRTRVPHQLYCSVISTNQVWPLLTPWTNLTGADLQAEINQVLVRYEIDDEIVV